MRILSASFGASDPDALTRWYEETLGVAAAFVPGERGPHHFAFHVADLAQWQARLELTQEYDFSSWGGARAAYFRDPEANVVELITRPQTHAELTLAEVGLPVADVRAAVDALRREVGLEPYDEWDDSFAPLGDEDGLLIVVREGRNWFPFEVAAGPAPVTVTVDADRECDFVVPGSRHRVISP